jgi:hypothetical protein
MWQATARFQHKPIAPDDQSNHGRSKTERL